MASVNIYREIPAGTMNSREDPSSCARRELTEETGYEARDSQRVGVVIPAPGMSDEHIYICKADGLVRSEQCLDHDEMIQVHAVPFSRALAMIREGTNGRLSHTLLIQNPYARFCS